MVNVYKHFLINKDIPSGCYNAGFENISILDIAKEVSKLIDTEILITESNDPRSYRQDSTKLLETGFRPQYGIFDAIKEIKNKYEDGTIKTSEKNYTVRWMKEIRAFRAKIRNQVNFLKCFSINIEIMRSSK